MKLFGKKSKKGADATTSANEKSQVGAVYVQGMNDGALPTPSAPVADEDLPVATPINAECVAVAPDPVKSNYDMKSTITGRAEPLDNTFDNSACLDFSNDWRFGRHPCLLPACPHCGLESRTQVRSHPNLITWGLSLLLLLIFWPLCWIPLVVEKMKQTDHYCALCHNKVASVQPCGDCFERRRR